MTLCYASNLLTFVLVVGTLKGYDQLMNLVLDEVKEVTQGKTRCELSWMQILSVYRRRWQHKPPSFGVVGRSWHIADTDLTRRRQ